MARLTPARRRALEDLARALASARSARLTWRDGGPRPRRATASVLGFAFDAPRWLVALLQHDPEVLRVVDLARIGDIRPSRSPARLAPHGFDALSFAAGNYLGWGAAPERRVTLRLDALAPEIAAAILPTSTPVAQSGDAPLQSLRAANAELVLSLAGSLGLAAAVDCAPPPLPPRGSARMPDTAATRCLRLATWLLSQQEPVNRAAIYAAFPEYYAGNADARERKFSRDKAALRRLGYALETVELGHREEATGYLLDARSSRLPALEFTADEGALLWAAGAGALRLNDHPLREELESALRKLVVGAKGLPPRAARGEDLAAATGAAGPAEQKLLGKLVEAWEARKTITVEYWRAAADEVVTRKIDVYGWASRRGEWIFAGHCHLRNATRVFYLSRVRSLKPNGARKQDPDYAIPAGFDIRRWSRQQVWDYEVHPPRAAAVRFRGSLARLARQLLPAARITTEEDGARLARLEVRNLRGLVRQALAWGLEAELTEPAEGRAMACEMLAPLATPPAAAATAKEVAP